MKFTPIPEAKISIEGKVIKIKEGKNFTYITIIAQNPNTNTPIYFNTDLKNLEKFIPSLQLQTDVYIECSLYIKNYTDVNTNKTYNNNILYNITKAQTMEKTLI